MATATVTSGGMREAVAMVTFPPGSCVFQTGKRKGDNLNLSFLQVNPMDYEPL